MFLYTVDGVDKLNANEIKNKYTFLIKHISTGKNFILVESDFNTAIKKDYLYDLEVNVPFPIPTSYETKYGIDPSWKNLTIKSIIDNIIGLVGLLKKQ